MVPGRGEFSGRSSILFLMCWMDYGFNAFPVWDIVVH